MVPCGTWVMKFWWGLAVTSIEIFCSIGKNLFIWDVGGSILVNVRKHSRRTSNTSWLDILMRVVSRVYALGVETSPNMVIVSSSPWKGMFSTSCALGMGGDGEIGTNGGVITSLEDEFFSPPILCFFYEDPTSTSSFNLFYYRSWKPTHRLATISSSFTSSIIDNTTNSTISHHSVSPAPNISSVLVTIFWA